MTIRKRVKEMALASEGYDPQQVDLMLNLLQLPRKLAEQQNPEAVLELSVETATRVFKVETTVIKLVNPIAGDDKKTMVTIFGRGADALSPSTDLLINFVAGRAYHTRESFYTDDITSDDRIKSEHIKQLDSTSVAVSPLIAEGTIIGVIILFNRLNRQAFGTNFGELIEIFAAIISPYLRNTQYLKSYREQLKPARLLIKKYRGAGLIGSSEKFVEMLRSVEAAANSGIRVLLEGPTGTGKELVARAIHRFGPRSNKPFIAVDCGAIQPNLVESELFGHIRGAFSGAISDRKGLFQAAHNGTIFLDEISSLSLELQAKLMRVLEEREIRPVGSNRPIATDARVITACSVGLDQLISAGKFREDLYYRINVYPIDTPALDERRDDIPELVDYFLHRSSTANNRSHALNPVLLSWLSHRHWQGNIRELLNIVEQLCAHAPDAVRVIDESMLPPRLRKTFDRERAIVQQPTSIDSLKKKLRQLERNYIESALQESGWNQSRAAESLRIKEQTLRYKMAKLGIKRKTAK